MFSTGTKKVIRDLLQEKRRTLTVLLAMIIGVFAVSMMSSSKSLLDNNLTENFLRTNPASFSMFVDDVNKDVLARVASMPSINQVTTRQSIWIRMKRDDGTFLPVLLYVVDDVKKPQINTYTIDEGVFPEKSSQIVIERTGKKLQTLHIGELLEIHFPGDTIRQLTLSGFTHDPGIAPSWMEGYLYGYISKASLPQSYIEKFPVEIKCTVAEDTFNKQHIENVALLAQEKLLQSSVVVSNIEIHEPGVHMHQKQMNALMFLILNFGVLALILSCFLILNMISAIMAKEVKQIAIMKATGASTMQIAQIYLSTIVIMAITALVIGTPLGLMAGKAFATFNSSMLNFELFDTAIKPIVLIVIILTGLLLPMLISLFPVVRASKVSIQKSLNDVGVENANNNSFILKQVARFVSSNMLLALRNTFRRKTRLALTVLSLALGGAIFITALNIKAATNSAIDKNFDKQPQDLVYVLSVPQKESKIATLLKKEDLQFELGYKSNGSFVLPGGMYSNPFAITAISSNSTMIKPVILDGRWIQDERNEVVLNQVLLSENNAINVGDKVTIAVNGITRPYTVVGICREMFTSSGIFVSSSDFSEHINSEYDKGNFLLVDIGDVSEKVITAKNIAIEALLKDGNVAIVNSITKAAYKVAVEEHLLIILAMLMSMTILVLIVGGLGMATSININISERKRELGILRSIGILKQALRSMVLTESLTMGILSWLFAIVLSIPLSMYLGNQFFTIFFESTIEFRFSVTGVFFWFGLSVLIAALSSIAPANKVINGALTDALSYE